MAEKISDYSDAFYKAKIYPVLRGIAQSAGEYAVHRLREELAPPDVLTRQIVRERQAGLNKLEVLVNQGKVGNDAVDNLLKIIAGRSDACPFLVRAQATLVLARSVKNGSLQLSEQRREIFTKAVATEPTMRGPIIHNAILRATFDPRQVAESHEVLGSNLDPDLEDGTQVEAFRRDAMTNFVAKYLLATNMDLGLKIPGWNTVLATGEPLPGVSSDRDDMIPKEIMKLKQLRVQVEGNFSQKPHIMGLLMQAVAQVVGVPRSGNFGAADFESRTLRVMLTQSTSPKGSRESDQGYRGVALPNIFISPDMDRLETRLQKGPMSYAEARDFLGGIGGLDYVVAVRALRLAKEEDRSVADASRLITRVIGNMDKNFIVRVREKEEDRVIEEREGNVLSHYLAQTNSQRQELGLPDIDLDIAKRQISLNAQALITTDNERGVEFRPQKDLVMLAVQLGRKTMAPEDRQLLATADTLHVETIRRKPAAVNLQKITGISEED